MNDWDDITMDELRAEDRLERQRRRPHWCRECLGHTGSGSPCAPDRDEQEQEPENIA